MSKKLSKWILLGCIVATSLIINACDLIMDDDDSLRTVTFYDSTSADADKVRVVIPVGGKIASADFPDSWAVAPEDGRVFLEWSVSRTGKGEIVDEDYIVTSNLSLYPVWGYEITDLSQIQNLSGVYKLTADVDLSSIDPWTPIGIGTTNSFKGVLYGDGHMVTGLSLYTGSYNGLFGVLEDAYIRDLHIGLDNRLVDNTNLKVMAGGLAGYAKSGTTITNVSVSGDLNISLTGDGYLGLIVGMLENSTLKNSFTTGSLSAYTTYNIYAGGLSGYLDKGTINNSYVLGNVLANTASTTPTTAGYAGGIAGYADTGSVISGNVVVSSSIYSANSDWIAGYSRSAQFSNNYYKDTSAQLFAVNNKEGSSVANVDIAFFRSLNWDFKNAWAEPGPYKIYSYPVAKRGNAAVWVKINLDTAADVAQYRVIYDMLTDISTVPSTSADFLLWSNHKGGRGDSVNTVKTTAPLDIYAVEGIKILTTSDLANIPADLASGKNYLLMNDLDVSAYAPWYPIGNKSQPFTGIFYGNGHTISGINLADAEDTGLFGVLNGAYIHNLKLNVDTRINSATYVLNAGALAGNIFAGTNVKDITVAGTINITTNAGTLSLGGVAGQTSSDITNSRVSAEIHGIYNGIDNTTSRVGGIVGVNNGVVIRDSVSTGIIKATNTGTGSLYAYAGGIAGLSQKSSTITTSYSTGDITATADGTNTSVASAGGIAGYNYSTIFATYSTGKINAINSDSDGWYNRANAGGIAGQSEGVVSVSYSSGDIYSTTTAYPHSAGIVGDLRTVNGKVYRTVGANATLTAVTNGAYGTYSNRIVGYINDNAANPKQAHNYANNSMYLNGTIPQNSDRGGTGRPLNELRLQKTYEDLNKVNISGAETLLWDFVNTWKTDGQSLPTFIWQN